MASFNSGSQFLFPSCFFSFQICVSAFCIILKQLLKLLYSMSDLSVLIQTQKQVVVDKNYIDNKVLEESEKEKCTLSSTGGIGRAFSSKDLRDIKVNGNYIPSQKRKLNSPRSYNLNNISSVKSQTGDSSQELYKIGMRVDALDQNQKRLEIKLSRQFQNILKSIQQKKTQYSELATQINSIKNQMSQSKRIIGSVLNDMTKTGK